MNKTKSKNSLNPSDASFTFACNYRKRLLLKHYKEKFARLE